MKLKAVYGIALALVVIGLAIVGYIVNIKQATAIDTMKVVPEKPSDFAAFKRDIYAGQLFEVCDINENYWRQPDFYASWENGKKAFYDNPDYSRWGVHGHGASPSEIGYEVEAMKEGDSFEICNFFHNGWGVWTYQGFELVPIENEYFKVEVTPKNVLLEPTFPVFEQNWVYKIKLKVIAKKDVVEGDYIIGYDVKIPDKKLSNEWTKQVLALEYENKDLYKQRCVELLRDKAKCEELINLREKKYVDGGGYKTSSQLFKLVVVAK